MEKPSSEIVYLTDWDGKLTDEWITYAQTAQSSHCRNINAHEKGARYTEDLFHKIDELVLMHAFGAAAIKGAPCSDLKKNFSPAQCTAAENVREQIVKFGKIDNPKGVGSTVSVQVISVTMLLVECPEAPKTPDENKPTDAHAEAPKEKTETPTTDEKKLPGIAQVAVFRVVKQDGQFCFIDHTARYYADWKDYVNSNKLPRCKMCFPRDGIYKFKQLPSSSADENNNDTRFALDLALAESNSCSNWERAKDWTLNAVAIVGAVAGLVSIVAAPFTGGSTLGVYAGYAAAIAGWASFGCMIIGTMATLGSLWDKYWHDEAYTTELLSLAMVVLHYGVAKYNATVLSKVKDGVPITRMELAFMTVLNCVRFGVDSIMFVTNCVRLVTKACDVGLKNISADEWLHFAMSAYFFGKTVFEPKTGYGIIKAAQQKYLNEEKRTQIKDKEALKSYDKLVDEEKRFGGDGGDTMQGAKDDWKGFTCSQEVCDELNGNQALIQNINGISDLNQFFLDVNDTNSSLEMTRGGKIMVNNTFEMHGSELDKLDKTQDGVTGRRRRVLAGTATMAQADADQSKLFDERESMTSYDYNKQMTSAGALHREGTTTLQEMRNEEGMEFLDDVLGPAPTTTDFPTKPNSEACAQKSAPTKTKADHSVRQSAHSAQQPRASAKQSSSSTTGQVNSTLWASMGLGKRQKICSGTTAADDSKNVCICRSVKIRVLYANMRSINPENRQLEEKIAKLRHLVDTHQPELIAIVETWLKPKNTAEQVLAALNLAGEYNAFRHDRADGHDPKNAHGHSGSAMQGRHGGGVLVLWKRHTFPNISFVRSFNEDYADNIVNFDLEWTFNCAKCHHANRTKKFIFTVVYRRPSPSEKEDRKEFDRTDDAVVNGLVQLNMSYDHPLLGYSGIAMVGDFNWRETKSRDAEQLQYITYGSDCMRMPLSSDATHLAGGALDQVFSSPGFVVNSRNENLPLVDVDDFVSDHAALVFSLYLGKDHKPEEKCESLRCF